MKSAYKVFEGICLKEGMSPLSPFCEAETVVQNHFTHT